MPRETLTYDIVIVGAGPSGLSTAIRLKQLANQHDRPLSICVIEKGATVGAHILSGNVFETRALDELIPNWKNLGAPITVAVKEDRFVLLSRKHAIRLPTPPSMRNHGNYIISLANFCRWLGEHATELGVDIFPGFAATEIIMENDRAYGVTIGDKGIDKSGHPLPTFQEGVDIRAEITILAEGCRGSLTEKLINKQKLRAGKQPQTYGLGIKEIWRVSKENHHEGLVIHTLGWPLNHATYGGSFLYHLNDCQIAYGFVVGLDYRNPFLSPFEETQRCKTHPYLKPFFKGGERIAYGARALNEGGWQSIPEVEIPGLLITGDGAGFLNVPKIKGTHTAMKSGMLAAETAWDYLQKKPTTVPFRQRLDASWIMPELYKVRNVRPAFQYGLFPGLAYAAIDTYLLRGKAPWTFSHRADHNSLAPAKQSQPIKYPKPDGQYTFDKLSSVYLSNTYHVENQPCHLVLKDPEIALSVNLALYDNPEQRYCPANVYEIVYNGNKEAALHINAQNCVHCKSCDIKDPTQNIQWTVPEGGGGPNYTNM